MSRKGNSLHINLHQDLTLRQKEVLRYQGDHIILNGPAGTSKTYLALARALRAIRDEDVERICIIRSAVETRSIGFLPGDRAEKMEVYTEPYISLVNELSPSKNYNALVNAKKIEFHSTSFLRGVTWHDSFIIADEYQNMNAHELETIVTRIGENTPLVLCGDAVQSDLRGNESHEHKSVIEILTYMEEFLVVNFTHEDIVRSEFVRRYFETKEKVNRGGLHRNLRSM